MTSVCDLIEKKEHKILGA